jgi:hypothetical protein
MSYYKEVNGVRSRISEWEYEAAVRVEGWEHVILQTGLAIIRKGKK